MTSDAPRGHDPRNEPICPAAGAPSAKYSVVASVKLHGDKDGFYNLLFEMLLPADVTRDQVLTAWHNQHGHEYEMKQLINWKKV